MTNVQPCVDAEGCPICEVCRERIDPSRPGVFALVQGWAETRAKGGANAISERKDLGRYRHRACHRHGNMLTLFDA